MPLVKPCAVDAAIHTTLEADGLLLACIDMPGRSMNVFSVELMDALDELMARVETDPAVRAVVLTSGKSSFLAGADLVMVRGYTSQARVLAAPDLFELCGRLGRQFVRLEACPKPWVAAVNGIALGGGLELAMACRARIVADDARIQLGLPEVRWGLLPGAGGTQRLPRLVGFEAGLELLLSGRPMAPQEALARGLFAQAVPAPELLEAARGLARSLVGQAYAPQAKFAHLAQSDVPAHSPATQRQLLEQHGVGSAQHAHYPAYGVIVDCVLLGARQPLAQATATEMWQFLRLMVDPVAGQMVRSLFLNRQRADKALAAPAGLRIEAIAYGALPAQWAAWAQALERSRLNVQLQAELAAGELLLLDSSGASHRVLLACLDGSSPPSAGGVAQAWLSAPSAYGRVLEIHAASDATAAALAALAARLGALPYRIAGRRSVLASLAQAPGEGVPRLDAQALLALAAWGDGSVSQPEWLDVAACAAGVTPPYCGGPFAHLWSERERLCAGLEGSLAQVWQRAAPLLGEVCA